MAAEALANGVPVLASRRGALPETLGGAGFLFDISERYTDRERMMDVPTPDEVAGWVDAIERLWDDEVFHAEHRAKAGAGRGVGTGSAPRERRTILASRRLGRPVTLTRAAAGRRDSAYDL